MTQLKCENVKPNCTGNEPTVVCEGNSKRIGSGIQLSDGNTSMSGKSEISSEVGLPLNNVGNFELNIAKIRLNGAEDESQQNRTESSCSNSLSIKPSVSLSNPSSQATERGVVDETLDRSKNSDNFNRPSKKEESITLHNEHDTQNISRSAERTAVGTISYEISGADKIKSECYENKSCEDDSKKYVAGFDLNDDISTDEMYGVTNHVDHLMTSHKVIRVVAKAAIPRGLPTKPLKFEGGLNWKGSAKTSAFHPVINPRNYSSKDTGFDLNVLAGEDCDSSSVISPTRKEGHGFDLNCFYEAPDEFTNHSIHESKNPPSLDLKSNKNLGTGNPGKKDFIFNSEPYVSEHGSMQHVVNKSHAQQCFFQPFGTMQRVPFQPQLPFMSHVLPPQSYPFKIPFHVNSRDTQPNVDYSRAMLQPEHSRENSYVTEMINTSMVHSNGPTYFVPKLDIKREDHLSRSGGKMDETRQFVFLANTAPTEDQMRSLQQQAWFANSAKRKEPEGGLEYYQLGYKQVT